VREAVDFLRYYAAQAQQGNAVGIFTCISPWNFPLAIFIGQVSAALATGNAVIAKPAEQTPLIAYFAVRLMHRAGVPKSALQLILGDGKIGSMLTSDGRIGGVAFTGSTMTAKRIRQSMADNLAPGSPFIAETGGLNAMIVDSTALLEQAVQAALESAFQSTGQRCSALRCLYVQEDIYEEFTKMLFGAMDTLNIEDPWFLSSDLGPIIDSPAKKRIQAYIQQAHDQQRVLKQLSYPEGGNYLGPTVIQVDGIEQLESEIFGPVLHLAKFKANEIDDVIHRINETGYGLTFGLLTRIDDRVQKISEQINAGNIYVNRNQIGAIVGSQPFGGNGLSGTGPKAGGPHYLNRFQKHTRPKRQSISETKEFTISTSVKEIQERINSCSALNGFDPIKLPGVTGESNLLSYQVRQPILCLGPDVSSSIEQAFLVEKLGGNAIVCDVKDPIAVLNQIDGFSAVVWWGNDDIARQIEQLLAQKSGPILPLITGSLDKAHVHLERHVCVDTTASGGNAELLSNSGL